MKQGKQGKHLGKNKLFLDFKINPAFMASLRTADQESRDFLCRPIIKGNKLFIDLF